MSPTNNYLRNWSTVPVARRTHPTRATSRTTSHTQLSLCPPTQQTPTLYTKEQQLSLKKNTSNQPISANNDLWNWTAVPVAWHSHPAQPTWRTASHTQLYLRPPAQQTPTHYNKEQQLSQKQTTSNQPISANNDLRNWTAVPVARHSHPAHATIQNR